MRFDRGLTLGVFQSLTGSGATGLPVLMYHSVSEDPEPGVGSYYRVTTSPSRFAEHMLWLKDLGFQGVSVEEALAKTKPAGTGLRLAVITFDDGFRDFHTHAWPLLRQHKFTATMYVSTGYIAAERKSFLARECLTWDEVRELRKQGARFGSHTVNHPKLYQLPWKQIEMEVAESKWRLEEELGEPVTTFAYPYAFPQENRSFAARLTDILRKCGYESCATTVIGRFQPGDDPFNLKRLPMNGCDDKALFSAKLEGGYDWVGRPQALVRRMKALLGNRRESSLAA
jgi:peptidoglycan/xylan/chitin deacetylase (PgdA/CDA1 family)